MLAYAHAPDILDAPAESFISKLGSLRDGCGMAHRLLDDDRWFPIGDGALARPRGRYHDWRVAYCERR